ncbi:hypothetical protein P5X00_39750 (plasmid) [Paraburkholderia sp. A2RO-4L]|uniref:hypothetical protein n=1 Tax=Paraburkholderia sp. A2RO-4L TaxID=3028374 RepID=UPI003DA8B0BD
MNVKFDVSQLDSIMRAAQDFQPCPELQGAGLFLSRLINDGAQRAIEIAKNAISDPSIDPADRVAALMWLETHGKG